MSKNDFDKIFEEIDARRAAREAEIAKNCAEFEADFAKYRKRDRILNILFTTCLVAFLALLLISVQRHNYNLESKNDACIEAGGVFVRVYGGFKCYSNDFRQELSIQ
jgi:hypothetical protein